MKDGNAAVDLLPKLVQMLTDACPGAWRIHGHATRPEPLLEAVEDAPTGNHDKRPASWTNERRQRQSQRMRDYWANKRKEAAGSTAADE
jgi:hypothetical protein